MDTTEAQELTEAKLMDLAIDILTEPGFKTVRCPNFMAS